MTRGWRRIMIILLVLLPALLLSEEVPKIDWTTCNSIDDWCSCLDEVQELYRYEYRLDSKNNLERMKNCTKFGLQNKFFNENDVLLQVQVKLEDGEQLEDGASLEVYQGPKLTFGCKLENGQVKLVEKPENKDFVKKSKITLFEDRSIMKGPIVLCAIQSKKAKKLNDESVKNLKTSVKLSWRKKKEIYLSSHNGNELFILRHESEHAFKCDPYSFKDLSTSKKYIVHPLRNGDRKVLNCDNYNVNTDLFTMRYQKIDQPDEDYEIKQLKCVSKNDDYYFVPGKIDPADETKIVDMEEITDPESYHAYCAAHFDALCESPIKGCTATETTTCPEYIPGRKATPCKQRQPATLTCPDGKWLINKEYYELEVSCMKNYLGDSNTVLFFAKLPSGRYMPVPEDALCARSAPVYDCRFKSKLRLPKKETSSIDNLVDDSNGILKCKNPDRKLIIYHPETYEEINKNQIYSCNPVTGSWVNGEEIVPSKHIVRCIDINAWPKLQKKLGIN